MGTEKEKGGKRRRKEKGMNRERHGNFRNARKLKKRKVERERMD